jgi:hypothetical protein
MALTKDFSEVLVDRIQLQPEFARALLGEAIAVFLNGDPDVAQLMRRDLGVEIQVQTAACS